MKNQNAFFKALAHPTRRKILLALFKSSPQPLWQIRKKIGYSQPTISEHLRVLTAGGIVKYKNDRSKETYFWIDFGQMQKELETFLQLFKK